MVEKRRGGPGGQDEAPTPKKPKFDAAAAIARAKAAAQERAAKLGLNAKPSPVSVNGAPNGASPPVNPPAPDAAPAAPSLDRLATMKAEIEALAQAHNLGTAAPASESKPEKPKEDEVEEYNPYWDPKSAGAGRAVRKFEFVTPGKYVQMGSKSRDVDRIAELKKEIQKQLRLQGLDENSEKGFLAEEPTAREWWDEDLVPDATYDSEPANYRIDTDDSPILEYVQHPVLLKANQDQLQFQMKPMFLTSKELAKKRRMRRAEDLKESQYKMRLGLEPPPPPKVKRANLMKVMGEQAIADPTAVEQLVENQIAQRLADHNKSNQDRKLTKEQRLEKLAENQKNDALKGLRMCVFRINSLANGKHRYQVDHNAKQNALTGVTLIHPEQVLIIVEGGAHSTEKYKRLIVNRIRWTENAPPSDIQREKQKTSGDPQWVRPEDENGNLKDLSFNKGVLIWEGEVKKKSFRTWRYKTVDTDAEAKDYLSKSNIDSLWALAKSTE
ncbi:PRP3-domain-containing protein [Polyplosphaeria fusca]|uniref:PRP3-domain-containing protein n=1 Tax=Polyplosphaeria fusca TaxID=682080 RepID=A0A9P4QV54_9PLEO|nr:PRP3-domain-containing protein [Polyplosphaeria fusca]